MKVANMTATATIHGLTWGCGSTEDGIRYYFHDAAKPPFDARCCHAPACGAGNPARSRHSCRLDPLESESAA
jgi:hypothetical protein